MNKTNAWLTIEGHQWSGEEPADIMKLSTEGSIIRQPDSWQIVYLESAATGLEGTETTVQVDDNGAISLLRTGTHNMRLTFVEGIRHISRMETPYGNLDIGIYTSSARADLSEAGGTIHLGYTIDFNNREPMNTSLDIIVRRSSTDSKNRPPARSGDGTAS
jgi:uncharacterized beta-barrel protein YwiB (DUF1934 family)